MIQPKKFKKCISAYSVDIGIDSVQINHFLSEWFFSFQSIRIAVWWTNLRLKMTRLKPAYGLQGLAVALFNMPNLNQFDILSISIFCKIALSILISISIFSKIAISISISISIFSKITLSISISISIFLELPYRYWYRYRYFSELPYRYRYRYRYFQKWPYRYWYRYRYFSKVSIYRQSICHIDISNRAIP